MKETQFKKVMKELEAYFAAEPLIDASDPEVYRRICRTYSEVVTPGLEATDRALLISRATAHTRVYKRN